MIGADLAVLFVPFLDGSSNRVEAGTDLEVFVIISLAVDLVRQDIYFRIPEHFEGINYQNRPKTKHRSHI